MSSLIQKGISWKSDIINQDTLGFEFVKKVACDVSMSIALQIKSMSSLSEKGKLQIIDHIRQVALRGIQFGYATH